MLGHEVIVAAGINK